MTLSQDDPLSVTLFSISWTEQICLFVQKYGASIDGYKRVVINDEIALRQAVAIQPVSVGFELHDIRFMLYTGVRENILK